MIKNDDAIDLQYVWDNLTNLLKVEFKNGQPVVPARYMKWKYLKEIIEGANVSK